MKKSVLVLFALLSLVSIAPIMAQPAVPSKVPAAAPAPDVAQFLATLADGQTQTPNDLMPAPLFRTGCTTQCPTGEICCFLCGNPPAEGDDSFCWGCITPYKGRCPLVV